MCEIDQAIAVKKQIVLTEKGEHHKSSDNEQLKYQVKL